MLVSFKVFQINAEAIARFPAMILQMSDGFEKTMDDFKFGPPSDQKSITATTR